MHNQGDSVVLAQIDRFRKELVQIARLGASGDVERLRVQVMRFVRSLRADGDPLAEALQEAVFSSAASARSPVRAIRPREAELGLSSPVPLDSESKLDLLRVEDPPRLPHDVVYARPVEVMLGRLVSERRAAQKLRDKGLTPPSTVLFTGPPGVGKTLAARWFALELGLPLLVLDLATVISSYLGRTGSNLKQAFEFARGRQCVLFLDEIDAVAKRRADDTDVGELKRLVTVLLQEIDLWGDASVLVAATNHPDLLDPAVWRRFDTRITFEAPSKSELTRLGEKLLPADSSIPKAWMTVIATLRAGRSQSDFVRDVNRVRRALLLSGKSGGLEALQDLVSSEAPSLSRQDRKNIAVSLTRNAGVSQREASRLAGVARETLRTALSEDHENG